MKEPTYCGIRMLALVGTLFILGFHCDASFPSAESWAEPSSHTMKQRADAERGRDIINGKGICFYCHGRDGGIDQLPQLTPETTKIITRLNPKPPDLRNPDALKLKTDEERFRATREGHSGTGMLPDTTLTNEEILDVLAYLSTLRREASSKGGAQRQ